MRTCIRYNPRNRGTRILHGPVKPGARQILLGEDLRSKLVRKTKKAAADLLYVDNKKHFLSAEQREVLKARAGKAYREPRLIDPFKRSRDETMEEYQIRIIAHIVASTK